MPCFELLLVLLGYLLILGPHLLHNPVQVLSFRSINIHMDATLGDQGTQFSDFLLREK